MSDLIKKSQAYLHTLCVEIPDRSVGSRGNQEATHFFEQTISRLGWETEILEFDAMDWIDGRAKLIAGDEPFQVFVSPYSNGCDVEERMITASNLTELEKSNMAGKIILLHGEIAKEQLMPKNFIFYNPEEHQRIISILEKGKPAAIIAATGRNSALAGGVYPFPLIEDGDFDIPSVYTTEEEGNRILSKIGQTAKLNSLSTRIPSKGDNPIARKGNPGDKRVVVTAHIDAKKGSPGAIDNASGVVVLLLLAEMLRDYIGDSLIELVAFNGEDYFAVPGQMKYIQKYQDIFPKILLNINIDGAGYKKSHSAFSFYGLPNSLENKMREMISHHSGLVVGKPWVQGDHSIFIQYGRPAIAVSSQWFADNIDQQTITHTSKDKMELVDGEKLVEIAQALDQYIRQIV